MSTLNLTHEQKYSFDKFDDSVGQDKSGWEDVQDLPSAWVGSVPRCLHRDHKPPSMMVIPRGKVYRHVCSGCGEVSRLYHQPTYCLNVGGSLSGVMTGLFLFITIFCVGCGPLTVPINPKDPSSPDKPTVQTVWTEIADYVDAGDIADSTKLELIVKRLRSHGKIDDTAVDKFYSAFPGIKEKELPITKADSSKLRGI